MKIGLEIHVALPTKSKLFCSCETNASEPNAAICPVCMGLPGSKPVLNAHAVSIAYDIANALSCKLAKEISFVRKIYFYPDLPKSYQITQLDGSIGTAGFLETKLGRVEIRRVQIEEDPAKIIRGEEYTLLDFNRSGQPLVEIVTEPDITSEDELRAFIAELKSILYYLDVDIENEIKIDLNISLADARVEVKNVTGTKNLVDAARYEVERQQKLISSGERIDVETRAYNEAKMTTIASREKETDEDYGFIYDTDLTDYDLGRMTPRKAIIASGIASDYANKYNANENTMLELIQFNKRALELIDHAKGSHKMQNIVSGVETLQKYHMAGISFEIFDRLLSLIEGNSYIDEEVMKRLESGATVHSDGADVGKIDDAITSILDGDKALIEECKSNSKAANFVIGKVLKQYKASPKLIAERLEEIISKQHNG